MDTVQGTTGPGLRDGEKFPTRTVEWIYLGSDMGLYNEIIHIPIQIK